MGVFSERMIENDSLDPTTEGLSGFSVEEDMETFDAPATPRTADVPSPAIDAPVQKAAVPVPAAVSGQSGEGGTVSDNQAKKADESEDAKRRAHEEAEAKRKAEFDARQAAKKAAQEEQLAKVAAMSDEEVMAASMKRVSTDTEKLTRRNMKECVAEYIQTLCIENPAFARLTMHPLKSMIHCFWYINRKAREFVEQEMKDNDIEPEHVNGAYGSDVPDDLCYSWAEAYFRDPDAEEDHRDEEKFVPRPYYGKTTKSKAASKAKSKEKKPVNRKQTDKKPADSPQAKPKVKEDDGQMSLLGVA